VASVARRKSQVSAPSDRFVHDAAASHGRPAGPAGRPGAHVRRDRRGAASDVARQTSRLPAGNILVEPSPRDSCAAIALAAAIIDRQDPGAVMGSFASDHLVGDQAEFVATVRRAIAGAERGS